MAAVLGLSGAFATPISDYPPELHPAFFHDAAACVVIGGEVVAATEEERVSRDKHTNAFPAGAVRECLELAGVSAADLDAVAYFFDTGFTTREIARLGVDDAGLELVDARDLIASRLSTALGVDVGPGKVQSVRHHDAHAAAAAHHSGFATALVVVLDGNGEDDSTSVYDFQGGRLERLASYPSAQSIGHFYTVITRFLGYRNFDEYKVMGLAAYGDPTARAAVFDGLWELGPEGSFRLDVGGTTAVLLDRAVLPRRSGEPLDQNHRDLAAAAQHITESIAGHVIGHWLARSERSRLALAGGVAQNTTMNGRLLDLPGLVSAYVHPAAHDAGAAVGAALLVDSERNGSPVRSLHHTYLGRHVGTDAAIEDRLDRWAGFVEWTQHERIADVVAAALADGEVLGWAQGRAEFGPRALGARSILADPRPATQRDRINRLIKQRESYRPFAPVVRKELADTYFDLGGAAADTSYMGFVVTVREEWRERLAAVTHIDGTARLQTLDGTVNPLLGAVLDAFGRRTGVPVLLNTSFNNYAEPIVHTVDDAVVCLLTTGLSGLAVGSWFVRRVGVDRAVQARQLSWSLMPACELVSTTDAAGDRTVLRRMRHRRHQRAVSRETAAALRQGPVHGEGLSDDVLGELLGAWDARLVTARPVGGS